MTTQPIIDIPNPPAVIPATEKQLAALGVTPEEIAAGEKRFETDHVGPCHVCRSIRAIVEDTEFSDRKAVRARFYPPRKCTNPKESGYAMEGLISLNGEKRHVFTSSQMFELPSGKLVDVATLHLCTR